jgi:integrase
MLAILLGCGLRRSEVGALTLAHVQQRDNRWCIVDLVGKHGRVRTIPMPTWVKGAIDAWTSAAGISEGSVLRRISRGDQVQAAGMSEKVVWQLLQQYETAAGVPGIAPHDLRTCAKLCGRRVVNWSRFNCCSDISLSKRPSDISAHARISCTRRMMGSS